MVVPAVTVDVVQRLFQAAEKLGLTTERRLEAGGVCIARMALHLIGGKTRYIDNPNPSLRPSHTAAIRKTITKLFHKALEFIL